MGDEREGLLREAQDAADLIALAPWPQRVVELLSSVEQLTQELQRAQDLYADAETQKIERGTALFAAERRITELEDREQELLDDNASMAGERAGLFGRITELEADRSRLRGFIEWCISLEHFESVTLQPVVDKARPASTSKEET